MKFEIQRSLMGCRFSPCQYIRGNGETDRPNTPSMAPSLDAAGRLSNRGSAANGKDSLIFITGVTHVRI
jgi:hypothetical protein